MTPSVPWRLRQFNVVESTNALAREKLDDAFAAPAKSAAGRVQRLHHMVFLAAAQMDGRGQHGRTFSSPRGGLYATGILCDVPAPLRPLLSLYAGVAAAQTLQPLIDADVRIRWPNDLFVANRKLGGILCEAVALGQNWGAAVGIGVNVNTRAAELGPPLDATATSLIDLTGCEFNTRDLAMTIFIALGKLIEQAGDDPGFVIAQVNKMDDLRGRAIKIHVDRQDVDGIGAGVSPDGHLMLETAAGPRRIGSGTIVSVTT